jgi:hypothetical protein
MAHKLSEQRIEDMFTAYCERQSITYVSKKCGVNYLTAKRYRDNRGWDGRLDEVRKKTEDKVEDTIAVRNARLLKVVDGAVASYAKQLSGRMPTECPECKHKFFVPVPALKATLGDIEKLARTHNLLIGEPTDRPGANTEMPKLIKLALPVPPGTFDALPTALPPEKPQNSSKL